MLKKQLRGCSSTRIGERPEPSRRSISNWWVFYSLAIKFIITKRHKAFLFSSSAIFLDNFRQICFSIGLVVLRSIWVSSPSPGVLCPRAPVKYQLSEALSHVDLYWEWLVSIQSRLYFISSLTPPAEAPFFPGVLFYLSKWYTKKELALRMSIFYSGSLVSGAFGSLIAAGILKGLDGARGLAAW